MFRRRRSSVSARSTLSDTVSVPVASWLIVNCTRPSSSGCSLSSTARSPEARTTSAICSATRRGVSGEMEDWQVAAEGPGAPRASPNPASETAGSASNRPSPAPRRAVRPPPPWPGPAAGVAGAGCAQQPRGPAGSVACDFAAAAWPPARPGYRCAPSVARDGAPPDRQAPGPGLAPGAAALCPVVGAGVSGVAPLVPAPACGYTRRGRRPTRARLARPCLAARPGPAARSACRVSARSRHRWSRRFARVPAARALPVGRAGGWVSTGIQHRNTPGR